MNFDIKIGNKSINEDSPCFIIAEMSANHNKDINIAKKIIDVAAESGADCIKTQTYTADTLTMDSNKPYFQITEGPWKGYNLYKLYEEASMPWEWHEELKTYAENKGLIYLSTAYDPTSVDFLEKIGISAYKIASFELIDIPLLKKIAKTKKPIILSTGMATIEEIEEAHRVIAEEGNDNLILLKCSSSYPPDLDELNLKTIIDLKKRFNCLIGYSDHSEGWFSACVAVAMGARVIEKHICLDKNIKTPDSHFSMDPKSFKKMIQKIRETEQIIGSINYQITRNEKASLKHRKSIFAIKDISKGEKFTEENIKVIRPADGLHPRFYDKILNKFSTRNIEKGMPIKKEYIQNFEN